MESEKKHWLEKSKNDFFLGFQADKLKTMSLDCSLQKGIDLATEAVQEDKDKNYEEAFRLYQASMECLMNGLKYERSERCKETIRTKVVEYMERADLIKEYLRRSGVWPTPKSGSSW